MTIKEYIDEVKIRLTRIGVARDIDDIFLATYINRARQQAQRFVMPITPDRYGKVRRYNLTGLANDIDQPTSYVGKDVQYWRLDLPDDFLDVHSCIVEWQLASNSTIYRAEARQATKFEMYNSAMNPYTSPMRIRPVYILENVLNDPVVMNDPGKTILISAGDNDSLELDTNYIECQLWYVHSLYNLDYWLNDNDQVTPYYLEELVINFAIQMALRNINDEKALDAVDAEVKALEKLVKELYIVKTDMVQQFMPSKEI